MKKRFWWVKSIPDPDNDPIAITHDQDPSLEEDEMIIHTMIDPESIPKQEKK